MLCTCLQAARVHQESRIVLSIRLNRYRAVVLCVKDAKYDDNSHYVQEDEIYSGWLGDAFEVIFYPLFRRSQ